MVKFNVFRIAKYKDDVNLPEDYVPVNLPEGLDIKIWYPRFFDLRPPQVPFSFVWVLYSIIFLFNKSYKGIMVYNKNRELIHHTFIIPYHFRFAFMDKSDIQISNVWTKDEYRNLNIATIIINQICLTSKNKSIWYICREDNAPSIKVAKKSNFIFKFNCERVLKFGLPIYRISLQ